VSTTTRKPRGGRPLPPPRSDRRCAVTPSRTPDDPSPVEPPPRVTITADELAALLGVDRKTVYEGAARGEIPSVRLGRRVLFARTAIDAWLGTLGPQAAMMAEPTRVTGKQVTQ
jgi:excisionase family DNA binding protein